MWIKKNQKLIDKKIFQGYNMNVLYSEMDGWLNPVGGDGFWLEAPDTKQQTKTAGSYLLKNERRTNYE